jgi:energy-coupling factor transporter ATP-binding protein EcfA2
VPERFPAALPFTSRAYLMHLGRAHGLRGATLVRAVGDGIEQLALADYAGTPLRELSKGTAQKVAVAQALLARPGLLVLDEAWTGLDERTRAVLDGAVAERLAGGAGVVFVDHDPARLAGRVTVRWSVGQGRVMPEAGPRRADELGRPAEPGGPVLVIEPVLVMEIEGYAGDPVVLTGWPGVLAAHQTMDQPGGVRLRVRAGASDDVLRHVLAAGPAVHVRSVRPEPGTGVRP